MKIEPDVKNAAEIVVKVRDAIMDGEEDIAFDTEVEAAMAHDLGLIFGGEKPVNFPQYDYMGLFAEMGLKGIPDYRVNGPAGLSRVHRPKFKRGAVYEKVNDRTCLCSTRSHSSSR